jgi:hypothetical protein
MAECRVRTRDGMHQQARGTVTNADHQFRSPAVLFMLLACVKRPSPASHLVSALTWSIEGLLALCAVMFMASAYGVYRLVRRHAAPSAGAAPASLLPVCSHCKKVRDEKGDWSKVDQFILEHPEAKLSHSICPDCVEELYGEFLRASKKDPSGGSPPTA